MDLRERVRDGGKTALMLACVALVVVFAFASGAVLVFAGGATAAGRK